MNPNNKYRSLKTKRKRKTATKSDFPHNLLQPKQVEESNLQGRRHLCRSRSRHPNYYRNRNPNRNYHHQYRFRCSLFRRFSSKNPQSYQLLPNRYLHCEQYQTGRYLGENECKCFSTVSYLHPQHQARHSNLQWYKMYPTLQT